MICAVKDLEDRECLEIEWDFLQPPYRGANRETFHRAGFWPTKLFRSYKDAALGFFKAFKTAVEASSPGYCFDDRNVQGLVQRRMGVVLGEEEYQKKDGSAGTRRYVAQVCSVQAIAQGDFTVPPLKKRNVPARDDRCASKPFQRQPEGRTIAEDGFVEIGPEGGVLPF